jgi:quinone-modifying oxidoreductase subunit QmoA
MENMSNAKNILVVGGGISGMTAAIEASEAGANVTLVEKGPYLGGRVSQLENYFPKLCPPSCGLEISLRRIRTSPRIRTLTLTEVESVTGETGAFKASLSRKPRFVNDRCTACGACVEACPVERSDDFNFGMGKTKAIYKNLDAGFPIAFVIDPDACKGAECNKCAEVCSYDAVDLSMNP